jgi:catechol 2,3-dioxygenase-like lactoylglutathione lyase family enzyme
MTVPHVLSIVTLGVADVARSVSFYQALGWRRASSSMAEIAWFDLGGPWLGLFGADALAGDAGLPPSPAGLGHGSGTGGGGADGRNARVTLALNVADEATVDAALDAAVSAGGTLGKPGTRADWGGYSGYFADRTDICGRSPTTRCSRSARTGASSYRDRHRHRHRGWGRGAPRCGRQTRKRSTARILFTASSAATL